MAWNEPGGNSNNQDPWGSGGGGGRRGGGGGDQKGPPDLDEAFRKLQDSLNGMFGGKKRSGGSSGGGAGRRGGFALVWIGLVVLLAVWLFNAIYIVDEQEQAVVLRFGKYHETVGPGLNIYFPPFDKKFQANVTRERPTASKGRCLPRMRTSSKCL
jgi:modulator of FtsH protease HflK